MPHMVMHLGGQYAVKPQIRQTEFTDRIAWTNETLGPTELGTGCGMPAGDRNPRAIFAR